MTLYTSITYLLYVVTAKDSGPTLVNSSKSRDDILEMKDRLQAKNPKYKYIDSEHKLVFTM